MSLPFAKTACCSLATFTLFCFLVLASFLFHVSPLPTPVSSGISRCDPQSLIIITYMLATLPFFRLRVFAAAADRARLRLHAQCQA
jgi:hypothetical protein